MKLTILGASAAYPCAGGACSGYLLTDNGTGILLDCGTGVVANLQKHLSIQKLSHIIISHIHADHFLDLIPLRYALFRLKSLGIIHRPVIHLPPGGAPQLLSAVSFLENPDFFSEYFHVEEYNPAEGLNISGIDFKFAPVPHYVPSWAISAKKGGKLTFSSDCAPGDTLVDLAAGSDIFLCAALLEKNDDDGSPRGHMTMEEAAAIARKAAVKHLLVSHFWLDSDYSHQLAAAKKIFPGKLEMAELNRSYSV
ncbi:MAG: MBL fold metallo-hydrolase [Dehalococcoidia bacterium]|nr:MBL fold metallo-hydrolase [Dehalococcoidia bacterium]